MDLGLLLGMGHHLDRALPVPEIDEQDPAVVALVGDPPAQGHVLAGVLGPELPASVGPHRFSHVTSSPRSTRS
jgi:hypothetical protein